MRRSFRKWFLGVTTIIALFALLAATFAWFSSNREVSTSTASARTGEENLELQISSTGASGFKSVETAAITQLNQTDTEQLMPVSTADLQHFVYAPVTSSGMATAFAPVDEEHESKYYHGRVYLRALGNGLSSGSKMDLYLDQSNGLLGENLDGKLLNAARLGLMFDGSSSSEVILRLNESSNSVSERAYNTVVNGVTLGDGQVLSSQGTSTVQAVPDPSAPVSDYTVSFRTNGIQLPDRPLLTMELGRIYAVDVYFYLEGCDPDCSDSVSFDQSELYLGFYGVLSQGADN